MKVWVLHRQLINWETADMENDWWLYKKEEDAINGFKSDYQRFFVQNQVQMPLKKWQFSSILMFFLAFG